MSVDERPILRRMTPELMKAGVERAVDASEQFLMREALRGLDFDGGAGDPFTALDALLVGLEAHIRATGPLTEVLFDHRHDADIIAQILNIKRAVSNGAKWRSITQLYARACKVTNRAALKRARSVVDTSTFVSPLKMEARLTIFKGQLRFETQSFLVSPELDTAHGAAE